MTAALKASSCAPLIFLTLRMTDVKMKVPKASAATALSFYSIVVLHSRLSVGGHRMLVGPKGGTLIPVAPLAPYGAVMAHPTKAPSSYDTTIMAKKIMFPPSSDAP